MLGIFDLKLNLLNQSLFLQDKNIESINETILEKLGNLAKNLGTSSKGGAPRSHAMCVNILLSHYMNNKYICDLQIVDIYQNIRPGRAIVLRKLLS